jgi:uncharacterized UPF0160 family protein
MIELVIFVVGLVFGWWGRGIVALMIVKRYDKQVEKVVEELRSKIVHVHLQKQGGLIYVYNEKTGEFLSQGSTIEDIRNDLSKRFPDLSFIATKSEMNEVGLDHDTL